MARPFLVSEESLAEMRDMVRFQKKSYAEAGSSFGYSRTSAFNAIARYEEMKGLDPKTREPRFGGGPIAAVDAPCLTAEADATQTLQDSTIAEAA